METFELMDFSASSWQDLKGTLERPFEKLTDFHNLIKSNDPGSSELQTLEKLILQNLYTPDRLLKCINFVRQTSLSLPTIFPSGKINRLNSEFRVVHFSRRQVLVLLAHMFLCTVKPTWRNNYWVTFHNWLTDGRGCALAYLQSLLGYFEESMMDQQAGGAGFWDEVVTFERRQIDPSKVTASIAHNSSLLGIPTVSSTGSIGDTSVIEIDFANKDIGFGTYGTQEEILFGASPEMCIAMLFCDSMTDSECILIKGARKVGLFSGYGGAVQFNYCAVPLDPDRNHRLLIAIDALDFSSCENPLGIQFCPEQMEREICKLLVGFSSCPPGSVVDTGNWGCGAFCGDKYLKATLQIIAATIAKVHLSFFTFGDVPFTREFEQFSSFFVEKGLTVNRTWEFLIQSYPETEQENVFEGIKKFVNKTTN